MPIVLWLQAWEACTASKCFQFPTSRKQCCRTQAPNHHCSCLAFRTCPEHPHGWWSTRLSNRKSQPTQPPRLVNYIYVIEVPRRKACNRSWHRLALDWLSGTLSLVGDAMGCFMAGNPTSTWLNLIRVQHSSPLHFLGSFSTPQDLHPKLEWGESGSIGFAPPAAHGGDISV